MPFVSELKHRKPFKPRIDLAQRLADIEVVLAAIQPLDIHLSTKREMLDRALWLVAELSGDFTPRHRSDGSLRTLGIKIQRDHVYPRSSLIASVLSGQEPLSEIVGRAMCCLVTEDEHRRLSMVPPETIGWDRYRFAEVVVRDMSSYLVRTEQMPHAASSAT
jgi:hypothetical protein